MLNYFNFKKFNDDYLLTNDFGRYIFLNKSQLKSLISGKDIDVAIYKQLVDNKFLYIDKYEFSENNKYQFRDIKNHLFEATSLHIFVLTNNCNMKCIYCQAKDEKYIKRSYMDEIIAEKSVDIALSSPSKSLIFEFQGGEPLTNFKIIKHIVLYTEAHKRDKIISYNLVSNLLLISNEIIDFLKEYHINISTSLDGNKEVHDFNRMLINNCGSFDLLKNAITKVRKSGIDLYAIQTTTKNILLFPKEIVDTYMELGFKSIFIRPLTKLGTADRKWEEIGYTAEEFIDFYSTILDYILELNTQGKITQEFHATIFLQKILSGYNNNYMELRSPCGATIGQLAYFYDGNIFTCDEGRMLYEMGNASFKIGNVFDDGYDSLMKSSVCKSVCIASLLENQLNCSDCVYQPYCGTCPVLNLAQDKDLFFKNKNAFRCKVYKGILDKLFLLIKEGKYNNILTEWAK